MDEKLDYLPEEMRDAQQKLNAAMKRLYHAQRQSSLWGGELLLAERDRRATEAWYGTVSMRWNPATNTMDAPTDPKLEDYK